MTTTGGGSATGQPGRTRGVLAGIALVLACLSLLLFSVGGWAHQVALNTDRFTAVVEGISTDPEVTDAVAHRLSVQVVEALDVQGRLEARLPEALDPLAGALALAIQDSIDTRLSTALRNPELQDAWVAAISATHQAIVALLRDQTEAAVVIDGYVYFDAFVLVGPALAQLQEIGIIPADVVLPDLTARETADALRAKLESALGVTLPADFGLVKLMPADRLLAAQGAVRIFDLLIVLLAVVTVALALAAIWLSRHRRRMLVFLGVGTVITLVLARLVIRGVESAMVSGITDADASTTVRAVFDTTVADLVRFTNWIVIGAAVIAIAAYLAGRPRWAVQLASTAQGAARQAGGTAAAAASGASAEVSAEELKAAARARRTQIERIGIGVIVFVLAWIGVGLEIAVIGAALVIVFYLALALLTGEEAGEDADLPPAATEQGRTGGDGPIEPEASEAAGAPDEAAGPAGPDGTDLSPRGD